MPLVRVVNEPPYVPTRFLPTGMVESYSMDDARAMVEADPDAAQRLSFEFLRSYELRPEDNWGSVLNRHCKVHLNPRHQYEICFPVFIHSYCYVIGNGARVKIKDSDAHWAMFNCQMDGLHQQLMIKNMWCVTFTDVVFECEENKCKYIFDSHMRMIFHNCSFYNVRGTVVRCDQLLRMRGCVFAGCRLGVQYAGVVPLSVLRCYFERCIVCVKSVADVCLDGNTAVQCVCFVLCKGGGTISRNTVVKSLDMDDNSLLTCLGGNLALLCGIHVADNRRCVFPVMEANMMCEGRVYFGQRLGTADCRHSSFQFCHIMVHQRAASLFSLATMHAHTSVVSSILYHVPTETKVLRCECGRGHSFQVPTALDITPQVHPNGRHIPVEVDTTDDEDTD